MSEGAIRLASAAYLALFLVFYGSVVVAFVLDSTTAALVAVGGLLATLAVHLSAGIFEYRRTMRREWPKVEPLTDDDEWDAA